MRRRRRPRCRAAGRRGGSDARSDASSAEGPSCAGCRAPRGVLREIAALVRSSAATPARGGARHRREYAEVDAARKLKREHVAAVAERETGLQRSASRAHALLQERLAERRQKHKARSAAGAVEGITFVASDTRAAAASIGPGEAEAKCARTSLSSKRARRA